MNNKVMCGIVELANSLLRALRRRMAALNRTLHAQGRPASPAKNRTVITFSRRPQTQDRPG